jgi:hypothetical protein
MKKIVLFLMAITLLITSCADSKKFKRADGTEFVAHAYGWADRDTYHINGVEYEVCGGNIVWSILTCETIVGPMIFTAFGLYEPVAYKDPALQPTSCVCDTCKTK